ncbi:glycosyltransferase family 4 protein [Cupriavidus sp. 8B]
MKNVVIVQRRLTDYRVPLFESMRKRLSESDIRLRLMVGQPTSAEKLKRDTGYLAWAESLRTRYWMGGDLCWQPLSGLGRTDLVIVTQENKLLYNHWMLLRPRNYKLAFWGHGRNMQADRETSWRECFKRWTARRADWWFAYTELTKELLLSYGLSHECITVLNNAIDTSEIAKAWADTQASEKKSTLCQLGLDGKRYAIVVGSLYKDKRLDFAVEAVRRVRHTISDLELVIMGDGPDRERVMRWEQQYPWFHWVGARKGREKAELIGYSAMMLNPGAVGLVVLDAFVFGKALVTVSDSKHGPEISYLKDGINGVISRNCIDDYADAIRRLVSDEGFLRRITSAARLASDSFTIEKMSERFCSGIELCLGNAKS